MSKARTGLVVALVGVVVLAGVAFGVYRYWVWHKRQQAGVAWDSFRRCLLGSSELEGVTPNQRFAEIAAMGGYDRRQAPYDRWPNRCYPYATALVGALRAVDDVDELLPLVYRLRVEIRLDDKAREYKGDFEHQELDALWDAVARAGLPEVEGPVVAEPPPPDGKTIHDATLGPFPVENIHRNAIPGRDLTMLLMGDKKRRLCSLDDGLRTITCTDDEPRHCYHSYHTLHAWDDGAPMWADREDWSPEPTLETHPTAGPHLGIDRSSREVRSAFGVHLGVAKDGSLSMASNALRADTDDILVFRSSKTGPIEQIDVPQAARRHSRLLGRWLFWTERDGEQYAIHGLRVLTASQPVGKPVKITTFPGWLYFVRACQYHGGYRLLYNLGGATTKHGPEDILLLSESSSGWTTATGAKAQMRAIRGPGCCGLRYRNHRIVRLYCTDRGAHVTWTHNTKDEHGRHVTEAHVVTCEGNSCRSAPVQRFETGLDRRIPNPLVPLGDKFLYLWSHEEPYLPGIRMKLAPIEQLADAPFRVVLTKDSHVVDVFPSGDAAIAIINTVWYKEKNRIAKGESVALRIDASGKVEAIAQK